PRAILADSSVATRGLPLPSASPASRWLRVRSRPRLPLPSTFLVVGLALGVLGVLAPGRVAGGQAVRPPGAGSVVTVAGVVLDEDGGEPVAGVHVELLEGASAGGGMRLVTVADGRFVFEGLSAGPLLIRARRVGYRPATVADTVPAEAPDGSVHQVTVRLQRAPAPLAGLIVTPGHYGVLQQKLGAPQTLTRDQITGAPQVGEDVFRLVGRLPGVAASDF